MKFVSWDIETDTSGGGGLEPASAGVTSIAAGVYESTASKLLEHDTFFATIGDPHTTAGQGDLDEAGLIAAFDRWIRYGGKVSPYELTYLLGWNSTVFDAPFVFRRAEMAGLDIELYLSFDPSIHPKYEPIAGFFGGYQHRWAHLMSRDLAYGDFFTRSWCDEYEVKWTLKDVGEHHGLTPVRVDREKIHELTRPELEAYNLSDVRTVASLYAASVGHPIEIETP